MKLNEGELQASPTTGLSHDYRNVFTGKQQTIFTMELMPDDPGTEERVQRIKAKIPSYVDQSRERLQALPGYFPELMNRARPEFLAALNIATDSYNDLSEEERGNPMVIEYYASMVTETIRGVSSGYPLT